MAVSLVKGQKIDLTKGNHGLSKLMIGLGWDVNQGGGRAFDLDASVFMLNAGGKCPSRNEHVYFGNLKHPSGAVIHMGDNLTGEGEGDDEQIFVDLGLIPEMITKLSFVVNIYKAEERGQNFGMVSNAFIRVVDQGSGRELTRYDLGREFSDETAVVVGEIYRHNGEWKFAAVGGGYKDGIGAIIVAYN